jgi:hypothetical protein
MRIEFKSSDEVWRRRGRPRKEVPEEVKELANRTYRTRIACVLHIDPEDEEEAAELLKQLHLYARHEGRKMRTGRLGDELRFQMVDKTSRKEAA